MNRVSKYGNLAKAGDKRIATREIFPGIGTFVG